MNTVTMTIDVPKWVKETKQSMDFISQLKFEALAKMEYYQSKLIRFERKYGSKFEEFKKKIDTEEKENFEEWDDFIIWEAFYQAYQEWFKRYKELEECMKL
ncbi:MAG: hypothetical protein AB1630_08005 [bacterium]